MNRKKDIAIGLIMVVLLVGTVAFTIQQQAEINELRLQIDELVGINRLDLDKLIATFHWTVTRDGVVIDQQAYHNVITNAGLQALRGHIGDTAVAVWDYIAIGTGTEAGDDATRTTLVSEIFRAQGTYATAGSYNWTITYEWPASTFSGQTVTEIGVLNSNSGGTLLNYDDSYSRTLQSTDTLEVIVNFQISDGGA